nr:immunoglobulin heavy chain junction region [Mus musculus]MBK4187554.1 immunoglobulin heavy chain junction region [Mus musculus]MBK4187555.1 immunoglobulin heavy chain junction region [Mus musculus]MBK4187556.1 immunoglobulin heavy chain junction region [Mus musculus]
CARDHILFDYW